MALGTIAFLLASSPAPISIAINWTTVISIITVCLAVMGTMIRIFGPKRRINDENLRSSPYLKSLEEDLKEKESKLSSLKDLVKEQDAQMREVKSKMDQNTNNLQDLRQANRDLVQRLDNLLQQFMDYMEN